MTTELGHNFEEKLKKFGYTCDELGDLLYKTNSFIAGGFVLNSFLQEDLYENSDIDIFIRIPYDYENYIVVNNSNQNTKFKSNYYPYEYLAKNLWIDSLEKKGYTMIDNRQIRYSMDIAKYKKIHKSMSELEYQNCALKHYIKRIIDFKNDNYKIQIIMLFDCKIEEYLDLFDLNICKLAIYSNGYDLDYFHNVNSYLSTDELQLIKNKKMYIHCPLYPVNLEKRILKYISRGFTWIHSRTFKEINITYNNDIAEYIYEFFEEHIITYEELKNIHNEKQNEQNKIYVGIEESDYEDSDNEIKIEINEETDNESDIDINFIKAYKTNSNNLMKIDIYDALLNYQLTEKDIKYKRIFSLDEFNLFSVEKQKLADEVYKVFDDETLIIKIIDTNINFKFDIAKHINGCSCGEVSTFLFNIIQKIQNTK